MSLTTYDITWYSRDFDDIEIITNYGNFRNVLIIGTKGYIKYNHVLAMRKLMYHMDNKPGHNLLKGFSLGEGVKDFDLVKMISHSWGKFIEREGKN